MASEININENYVAPVSKKQWATPTFEFIAKEVIQSGGTPSPRPEGTKGTNSYISA